MVCKTVERRNIYWMTQVRQSAKDSVQITVKIYLQIRAVYYRPQTKLREGNVFTGVCLSTG